MSKLEGKVALVTAASKGIGAGIANAVASAGAAVVVNYASDRPGAEAVSTRLPRPKVGPLRPRPMCRRRPTSPECSPRPKRRSARSTSS